MLLLLPADPLSSRRPDPHWSPEGAAAQVAGHTVALLDHDALEAGRAAEAVRRVPADDTVVYRGWMTTAAQYAALATALATRGAVLRTTADAYRRAHELPGWYDAVSTFTPLSAWTVGDDLVAFDRCCARLVAGPAVLRDYTKSLKHHWAEAAFIPEVADQASARRVAERFRALRDDAFTGGYVVRRFERLVGAEARTWWRGGVCVLQTAHPDTADQKPVIPASVLTALSPAVAWLGLSFATADLVRRDDGVWRVVELGDGQVGIGTSKGEEGPGRGPAPVAALGLALSTPAAGRRRSARSPRGLPPGPGRGGGPGQPTGRRPRARGWRGTTERAWPRRCASRRPRLARATTLPRAPTA